MLHGILNYFYGFSVFFFFFSDYLDFVIDLVLLFFPIRVSNNVASEFVEPGSKVTRPVTERTGHDN